MLGVMGVVGTILSVASVMWLIAGKRPAGEYLTTRCGETGTMARERRSSEPSDTIETARQADLRFCTVVFWLALGACGILWIVKRRLFLVLGRSIAESLSISTIIFFGPIVTICSVILSFGLIVMVLRNRRDIRIWALALAAIASSIWAVITWISFLGARP